MNIKHIHFWFDNSTLAPLSSVFNRFEFHFPFYVKNKLLQYIKNSKSLYYQDHCRMTGNNWDTDVKEKRNLAHVQDLRIVYLLVIHVVRILDSLSMIHYSKVKNKKSFYLTCWIKCFVLIQRNLRVIFPNHNLLKPMTTHDLRVGS